MTTILLLIFLLAAIASFIQRVSGFGFGVFVMMFFPFILPTLGESATLSGLLAGTASLIVAIHNWKYIRWKTVAIILLANVIVAYPAISFMSDLGNDSMKTALGIILILIGFYSLLFQGKIRIPSQSVGIQALTGAVCGITGGMFGMPGPPVVLYCIEAIPDKKEYVATLQALFFSSNVFYTIFRAKAGFFTGNTFDYWLVGLAGLLIGTLLGAKCFEHISGPHLKKIVYAMMIASGIVTLF